MAMSPFTKRLGLMIAALNLFVVVVTMLWLEHSLEQYRSDAQRTVDNLAHVLQASLSGTIRPVDLAMRTVADEYRRQSAAGRVDEDAINALMARQQAHLPEIESLRATDAKGSVKYGVGADPRTNLADREFFVGTRDNPDAGLLVAKPVFARIAKKWVIVFARRLEAADGRFAGTVYVNLALDRLGSGLSSLDIGPSGSAALRGTDLGLIVRVPDLGPASPIGDKVVSPQLERMVRAGRQAGAYLATNPLDRVERASAFRRVDPYPLIVTIGLAEHDYLSVWRQEVLVGSAMVVLFALVTLSTARLLVLAWRRQEATAAALSRNKEDLEARVLERTAQLEVASRELEEFSYSISHDMRSPLRAIDGYSRILLEEHQERLDEEGRRLLKALGENAGRMGRMIDDILRFLGMGRRRLNLMAFDIATVVREAVESAKSAAPERSSRVEVSRMPQAWGDPEMLKQLLIELIGNALKFSLPEREAFIEIGGREAAGENIYYVRDHGQGFDMRYAGKLFKVFERVHATGQYGGSGIGLAIVKRIVDRHNGRVWAEGGEGRGATFYFTLPHAPAGAARSEAKAKATTNA